MINHLISIIVPVHKITVYLRPCIQSALNQTHVNIEVIIICNGNLNIKDCSDFLSITDNRLIIINSEKGRHNARNLGLQTAKGNYIQFLDFDDILYSNKLEIQLLDLDKASSQISICKWKKFASTIEEPYVFPFGKLFEVKNTNALKLINSLGETGGFIATSAYLIPSILAKKVKWIDAPNDDAVYFSELCKANPKVIMTDMVLAGYRIHQNNTSSNITKKEFLRLLMGWMIIEQNLKF